MTFKQTHFQLKSLKIQNIMLSIYIAVIVVVNTVVVQIVIVAKQAAMTKLAENSSCPNNIN